MNVTGGSTADSGPPAVGGAEARDVAPAVTAPAVAADNCRGEFKPPRPIRLSNDDGE